MMRSETLSEVEILEHVRDRLISRAERAEALVESLKRCGTCRHWRTWSAVCCIQQAEKIRKETCDKWEIDE